MAEAPNSATKRSATEAGSNDYKGDGKISKSDGKDSVTLGKNQIIFINASDGIPRWETVKLEKSGEFGRDMVALSDLNRLVGGSIEAPPLMHLYSKKLPKGNDGTRYLQLYVNESGRINGLAPNKFSLEHGIDEICGNAVIAVGAPGGYTVCFTKSDLKLLPHELVPK